MTIEASNPLVNILYFLIAATITVPLFRRIGLGSILGYLCAGTVIGPQCLGLIMEPQSILHFSEIGVILFLFLIGLEINPQKLWQMRSDICLLGGSQLLLSALAIGSIYYLFISNSFTPTLLIALALTLSSTAFAVQLMAEKNILGSRDGRRGFAILLMQDLAVIPILLIAQSMAPDTSADADSTWWLAPLAIAALLFGGHFFINPCLALIARYGGRESMTAAALLIVVGSALMMEIAHLSMGLGAFAAGILLANSNFRHQLETDIEPFKGLLLGLFFIAIGMTLNIQQLIDHPFSLLGYTLALMVVKASIITLLMWLSKVTFKKALLLGTLLSQSGEFGFVIMAQAINQQLLPPDTVAQITLIIGLSMGLTTPLLLIVERLIKENPNNADTTQDFDHINEEPEVLILGFGRFGQITGRILSAAKIPFTAIDKDIKQIHFLKRFGNHVYFGDPTRTDLLEQSGVHQAKTVIVATDNIDHTVAIASWLKNNLPSCTIIARARDRLNAMRLIEAGVDHVIREVFDGSLQAAQLTLTTLGYTDSEAANYIALFKEHDAELMSRAQKHTADEEKIASINREGKDELEALFNRNKPS